MNELLEERHVHCPGCGERFCTLVDLSAGNRSYIEDCPVCCEPIEFELQYDNDTEQFNLTLRSTR